MRSGGLTAVCPVTGQPDWPDWVCIESKSPTEKVRVTLEQKSRGGITITATS
jgi:NADPH-dependent 7-cyano-7-deazaguanine reductase QueF